MKIGFFGTPEISAYYLEKLAGLHDVVFTITAIDKPKGRHGTPSASRVKAFALEHNIPVLQPVKLLDANIFKKISVFNADIFVVVAYGKLIPAQIFNIPRFKTINVHPSLLPKYRGAAPIQWALINGENETGITIQYINEGLDTGDILGQKKIQLNPDINSKDLYDIVLPMGSDLLLEVLDQLLIDKVNPVRQNNSLATYCGKIDKNTAHIKWNASAFEIHNLVRGLNPKPVAWSEFRDKTVKIYKTIIAKDTDNDGLKPGFLKSYKKKLVAGTGNGTIEILELQPEGKKIMDAGSFINGYRISEGDFFN